MNKRWMNGMIFPYALHDIRVTEKLFLLNSGPDNLASPLRNA